MAFFQFTAVAAAKEKSLPKRSPKKAPKQTIKNQVKKPCFDGGFDLGLAQESLHLKQY